MKLTWCAAFFAAAALFAVGCAAPEKMEASPSTLAAIKLAQVDPPAECQVIGAVEEPVQNGDAAGAEKRLREAAVVRSGNYVRLFTPTGGTLYRCPDGQSQGVLVDGAPSYADVRVMTSDPPRECNEVGVVQTPPNWGNQASMRDQLKMRARGMGANYIRLELPWSGTAFHCPAPKEVAAPRISG